MRLFVIYAFHDIKKLFDSMDPNILFQAVMVEQFPKGTFVLAITRYLVPRLLVLASFCAMPQPISSSILAGCFLAVALTRCYNRKVFTEVKDLHQRDKVDLDLYIDDCNQFTSQYIAAHAIRDMHNAIVSFAEGTKRLRLTLSEKAGRVSHPPWLAVKVSKYLKTRGIYLKARLSYKYLGTDFTGGANKCKRVLMDRYKDTRNRRKRNA